MGWWLFFFGAVALWVARAAAWIAKLKPDRHQAETDGNTLYA